MDVSLPIGSYRAVQCSGSMRPSWRLLTEQYFDLAVFVLMTTMASSTSTARLPLSSLKLFNLINSFYTLTKTPPPPSPPSSTQFPSTPPLFFFREGQGSRGSQANMAYQVAVRLVMFFPLPLRLNEAARQQKGIQRQAPRVRDSPCSYCQESHMRNKLQNCIICAEGLGQFHAGSLVGGQLSFYEIKYAG